MTLIYRDQLGVRLRSVAWSPDGTRIASASSNGIASNPAGLVQVWEANTGTIVLNYRGHPFGAMDVAWSLDGARLASAGGPDGTAQVWDAQSGELLITYQDSQRVAAAAAMQQNETAKRARVGVGLLFEGLIPLSAATQWVQALGWLAGGARVVSTSANDAHVWEAATGQHLFTYGSHRAHIALLADSPDGRHAASVTGWLVQVWEAVTKARGLLIYRGHTVRGADPVPAPVSALAWSPDGTRLASGTAKGLIQVWDATSGATLLTYRGHYPEEPLEQPRSELEALRAEMNLRLGLPADTPFEETRKALNAHFEDRTNQSRARLVENTRQLYDSRVKRLVSALAWSPDSTRIASGSRDQTVQVWEAQTGHHLHTYQAHTATVMDVAWSPDGSKIASADSAGLVHIWPVE
jgi:WD40 repeat protein